MVRGKEEEVKTRSGSDHKSFFVSSLKLWNYITSIQKYVELGVVMCLEDCSSLSVS